MKWWRSMARRRKPDAVVAAFDAKIDTIDFAAARDDVLPFIDDASELEIWGRDYFKAVVRQMKFE